MINICFHGIGTPSRDLEPGEDLYWISRDEFLRIADDLARWPEVAISFDDGNTSDVEIGLPALLERGLTATTFALAGRLGRPGSLDADHLVAWRDAGMRTGTHGMHHRPWRGLDARDQAVELVDARDRLAEAVGRPVTEAACPLGRYDRRLLGALRRLGYTAVHTSDRRPARAGAWVQPRYSVRRHDTAESLRDGVLAGPSTTEGLKLSLVGLAKSLR